MNPKIYMVSYLKLKLFVNTRLKKTISYKEKI